MKKPISAAAHGIIDYVFAATQLTLPAVLGLSKSLRTKEAVAAGSLALYSAFTKYPVGIRKVIPFKTHRAIDIAALAGLGLLSFSKDYRTDRRAQMYRWGMIAAGALNVLLTDWED